MRRKGLDMEQEKKGYSLKNRLYMLLLVCLLPLTVLIMYLLEIGRAHV